MTDGQLNRLRTHWAAVGAAVAITLGAGGIGIAYATQPAGAVAFVPITPCRIMDTRSQPEFNVGPRNRPIGPGDIHTVSARQDTGKCTGIPTTATALLLNVTAVGATLDTFLTFWPTGGPMPDASSLNPSPGQPPTPNAVTTALSTGGQFDIFNLQGTVDVIADVSGYYVDHNHDDRYRQPNTLNIDSQVPTGQTYQLLTSVDGIQIRGYCTGSLAGVILVPAAGGQLDVAGTTATSLSVDALNDNLGAVALTSAGGGHFAGTIRHSVVGRPYEIDVAVSPGESPTAACPATGYIRGLLG